LHGVRTLVVQVGINVEEFRIVNQMLPVSIKKGAPSWRARFDIRKYCTSLVDSMIVHESPARFPATVSLNSADICSHFVHYYLWTGKWAGGQEVRERFAPRRTVRNVLAVNNLRKDVFRSTFQNWF
jgi:hypothetical protein